MNNIYLDSKRVRQYDTMKTIILLPPLKTDDIIRNTSQKEFKPFTAWRNNY